MQQWTHTSYTQQLVFGSGSLTRIGKLLKELGLRRVLLVTTTGRHDSDDGERVRRALGTTLASTFAEVESHVPVPLVQRAVQQARRDAVDGVVSFGGGSCADLGKAVCFFTEQEAGTPGASYADRPALPHVTVPTTYSGAELTGFFGMTDPAARQKTGGGGPTITPIAAIYDPDLTLSTPPRVSAETGMNALAHCVEAVYSPKRTPEAEAIALAGAKRIMNALPLVVNDPGDVDVRASMFEGAALAGRALHNGTMGVHHGLSQLVGGRTGIPHGLANAMILPHAMRFNAVAADTELERLAQAIGATEDAASAVAALVQRLGLPSGLGECGVTLEDLDAVARLSQSNHSVRQNVRPVSEDEAREVLAAAY
ncbi:MAG TPA: iron-containing alcohol dehydrogenase [Acidimicrobiales bacterium]|jgi:alcohol dehydrogenase class IV|nr:iron-containing alcohol dehydrogenase [Acidimicrobiales bacterium]